MMWKQIRSMHIQIHVHRQTFINTQHFYPIASTSMISGLYAVFPVLLVFPLARCDKVVGMAGGLWESRMGVDRWLRRGKNQWSQHCQYPHTLPRPNLWWSAQSSYNKIAVIGPSRFLHTMETYLQVWEQIVPLRRYDPCNCLPLPPPQQDTLYQCINNDWEDMTGLLSALTR